MVSGLVFNVQRYSIHDGPGIRTTVFLKGCPLRCAWCHNPESKSPQPELTIYQERCVRCGACWEACPQEHLDQVRSGPLVDRVHCIRCGRCVEACVNDARQLVGQTLTIDQLMAELLKDRIFYDDSGGGVTVSGGEPLMQAEFVRQLLDACRDAEISTAVDTCGFGERDDLLAIAPLTDIFLYDVKILDDEKHIRFTGVSNAVILENLRALAQIHSRIWIRVPLVPGFNDSPADIAATARFVASLPGVCQVNLLPYHPLGLHKSERLGTLSNLGAPVRPSAEALEESAEPFRSLGLNVKIGG